MTTMEVEPMTERQLQVARLVERGQTNEEIAAELGISPSRVKQHIGALRRKLGVEHRRLIAPELRDRGLV